MGMATSFEIPWPIWLGWVATPINQHQFLSLTYLVGVWQVPQFDAQGFHTYAHDHKWFFSSSYSYLSSATAPLSRSSALNSISIIFTPRGFFTIRTKGFIFTPRRQISTICTQRGWQEVWWFWCSDAMLILVFHIPHISYMMGLHEDDMRNSLCVMGLHGLTLCVMNSPHLTFNMDFM